jgi:deoxyribodipyrimidine photo-lyase
VQSVTSSAQPVLVWLRDDLRMSDNPALAAAVGSGRPVVVIYAFDDTGAAARRLGAASRWWLHHSLEAVDASLRKRGNRLVLRRGNAVEAVSAVLRETGGTHLYMNRRYAPGERDQDRRVQDAARALGAGTDDFAASLLHEPGEICNADGEHFGVFTPFWRAFRRAGDPRAPLPPVEAVPAWSGHLDSVPLAELDLLPSTPDWAAGLREAWTPGEKGALRRLDEFVHERLLRYVEGRNLPAAEASSRLSPHLKFGEVSPYQVWHAVQGAHAPSDMQEKFLSELGWREFNYDLLATHGDLAETNIHRRFDRFPWVEPDPARLRAWQRGRTGFPVVDAGMRQLWHTGWMHNRLRMVTASFLIKNLHYDWRIGEAWFWDTLVDGDPANNTAQWQWVAGSGADAAPFFRVFNPVTQGRKFDPDGDYIRRWVPELRALGPKEIHEPWTTGTPLGDADGRRYPAPILDLMQTRREALDAYESIRSA